MSTAREIMHLGVASIREDQSLAEAAAMMRDLQVGALPINSADDRLLGMVTDRDIVVRCVAEGRDPQQMTAREMAQGSVISVDVDADATIVLQLMQDNQIRRLPVIEERSVVGMISEADLALHLDEHELSVFASAIYSSAGTAAQEAPTAGKGKTVKRR